LKQEIDYIQNLLENYGILEDSGNSNDMSKFLGENYQKALNAQRNFNAANGTRKNKSSSANENYRNFGFKTRENFNKSKRNALIAQNQFDSNTAFARKLALGSPSQNQFDSNTAFAKTPNEAFARNLPNGTIPQEFIREQQEYDARQQQTNENFALALELDGK
jgi:hypothetical protein